MCYDSYDSYDSLCVNPPARKPRGHRVCYDSYDSYDSLCVNPPARKPRGQRAKTATRISTLCSKSTNAWERGGWGERGRGERGVMRG